METENGHDMNNFILLFCLKKSYWDNEINNLLTYYRKEKNPKQIL